MSETKAIITIVGKDQASGEIRKATAALNDLSKTGDKVAAKGMAEFGAQAKAAQFRVVDLKKEMASAAQIAERFPKSRLVPVDNEGIKATRSMTDALKGFGAEASTAKVTLLALKGQSKLLSTELASMAVGTEQWVSKSRQLQTVSSEVRNIERAMKGLGNVKLDNKITSLIGGQLGIPGGATLLKGAGLGIAAGGASVVALGMFGVAAAKSADQLQAIHSSAEVVYGKDFPEMEQKTNALAASLHRGQSEILSYASSFSGLFKSFGIAKTQTDQMGLSLSKLSVDFGKAFHVSDDQSFEIIQQALSGAGKEYQKYSHIVMTEAVVANYAESKSFKDKYENMSDAQKALVRYLYLEEQSATIAQTAAKNTGSLDDATKRLAGSWAGFKEASGPASLTILATAANIAAYAFDGLAAAMKGVGDYNAGLSKSYTGTSSYMQSLTPSSANKTPFGPAYDEMAVEREKTRKAVEEAINGMPADGGSAGKGLKEIRRSMEDLGKTYQEKARDINQKLNDLTASHKDKMASLKTDLGGVTKALVDLQQEYANTVAKIQQEQEKLNKSTATSKADIFVQGDSRVKDLQDQLFRLKNAGNDGFMNDEMITVLQNRTKENQGQKITGQEVQENKLTSDQENILNLQIQLDKELAAQKKYAADRTAVAKQMADKVTYYNSSETEQAIANLTDQAKESQATIDQRKKDEASQYNDAIADQKNKYAATQDAMAKEDASYSSMRDEYVKTKKALQLFGTEYAAEMANINKVTDDTLTNLKDRLEGITGAISDIRAALNVNADVTGGNSFSSASTAPPTVTATNGSTQRVPTAQESLNAASKASQEQIQQDALDRIARRSRKFADGGVVNRPTIGTFGEAGYPEAFIPMPSGNIPVKVQGQTASNSITITIGDVTIKNDMDAHELARMIANAVDNQLLKAR